MQILTETDKATYFPDVELTGAALNAALRQAQAIAEGPAGANRTLSIKRIHEVRPLSNRQQSAHLTHFPIYLTPAPVVEVQTGGLAEFGRQAPLPIFQTLTPDQYLLETITGELRVNMLLIQASRVRIEYTSGIDFTDPTSDDAETVRWAIADLLRYTQTPTYREGINSKSVPGFYSVSYGSNNSAQAIDDRIASYLYPLVKYRPRGYVI